MSHIGVRMETLAQHSLSHDFSSKTSGGARIPRDALGTAQDTSLLSSGGSLCAPAAFLDETYLSHRLTESLTPAVILEGLGNKMCVEKSLEVSQSDWGVFNAAVFHIVFGQLPELPILQECIEDYLNHQEQMTALPRVRSSKVIFV